MLLGVVLLVWILRLTLTPIAPTLEIGEKAELRLAVAHEARELALNHESRLEKLEKWKRDTEAGNGQAVVQ
jgi:hypothetical protein